MTANCLCTTWTESSTSKADHYTPGIEGPRDQPNMAKARNREFDSDPGPISQEGRATTHPELCRKCAVPVSKSIHNGCDFCVDLAFDEGILCDLTRSVQNWNEFGCYAFRPVSKPRLSPIESAEDLQDDQKPRIRMFADDALLSSDRFRYRHALAVQRIRSGPGQCECRSQISSCVECSPQKARLFTACRRPSPHR